MAMTPSTPRAPRATAALTTAALAALALAACSQSLKLMKDDSAIMLSHQTITAQNPPTSAPSK